MFAMTKAMRSKGAVRLLLIASAMTCCATPAFAQEAAQPSESAMVNLVRQLVKQGVLTRDAGEALMRQAEAEATQAKAANAAAPAAQAAANTLPGAPAGTIRVPYVPETVRQQIRDEIRGDVMREAKAEGWASPGDAAPDWTKRISIHGDIRVRSQSELYSKMNSDRIFDLARINAIGPVDLFRAPTLPYLNTRSDHWNRLKLRARLGLEAQVTRGVTAAFALATGDDNGPISTNANLGGGLGKRDIWLDLGYLRVAPVDWFDLSAGRFANPFASTPLLFDEDLRFDGVVAELDVGKLIGKGFDLAIKGGAFPLDFGSSNYPETNPVKAKPPVKYLYSAEIAAGVDVLSDVRVAASAAYHSFQNVQGQLSTPCELYRGATECSTDGLRPFFMRKGNTLSSLRQIVADPTGLDLRAPQFLGLAFDYDILDLNASVRIPLNEKTAVRVAGNYLKNLSFSRKDVCRNGILGQPFNNGGLDDGDGNICSATNPTSFVGGDTGYLVSVAVGYDKPRKAGEWNVSAEYRYLESDAVLDSLTDSDFHLGGTNAKGYVISGKYGIRDGLTLGAHWYSANEVSGEPLSIDVLQIDLNAAF